MIGHNAPPPLEAMGLHIEDLFALVSGTLAGGPVATDEQEAALDALLDDLRKAAKDADKMRADEKRPHDEAAKAVQAAWKPLLDRCDIGAREIKAALTPYREARQRAKDEAARKAREAAEAKASAAQAALRQSDDLEARFEAEAELKAATKLVASANRIDRSATGLRTYWRHRIVNRRDLLFHVAAAFPDELEAMLDELVRRKVATGARSMPGVEIFDEKIAA